MITIYNIFIPLYVDFMFTEIFNNYKNIDILENLLENYFDLPLNILKDKIDIKHRNLSLKNKNQYKKQVDLLVEIEGRSINIELNNTFNKDILNRNLTYAEAIASAKLKSGDKNYAGIKQTIQINLNTNYRNKKKVIEKCFITNEDTLEKIDNIEIDLVDLQKGKFYNKSRFDNWCCLILAKTKEEFKKALEGIDMKESMKEKLAREFEELNADEECIALYSDYTQAELERNTVEEVARREALAEGEAKVMNNVAKNMLKKGYNANEIAEITKMPLEEINKLKKQIKGD